MFLTKEEVWIASQQADYRRPVTGGFSEEQKRSRTAGNFWSEGDQELQHRPAQKIPLERYKKISEQFKKLVSAFLSIDRRDLNYKRFYAIAEELGVYKP